MYSSPHGSGGYVANGYPGHVNHHHQPPQPCAPPYVSGHGGAAGKGVRWSTGLCHCCNDPANCLVTAVCPCVTFGQVAEIVNRGQVPCAASGTIYAFLLGLTGLSCMYSCFYRSKLRGQYDLEEAPVADCLLHFCCETCALCQEYRELKNRGFDMGIGWQANMDRQSRGVTGVTVPPVGVSMNR